VHELTAFLAHFPPGALWAALVGLFFVTSLGVLPSNTDVMMLGTGALVALGQLPAFAAVVVTLAILAGETTMFLAGRTFGDRILASRVGRRILSERLQERARAFLQGNLIGAILSVRVTPVMRPWVVFTFGSLRVPPRKFFAVHVPATIAYAHLMVLGAAFLVRSRLDDVQAHPWIVGVALGVVWLATWIVQAIANRGRGEMPHAA
jgi:membrane protein DedA with SNARE-associated domain